MIPGSNSGLLSVATAAYLLEQSALFDGAAYLSRTPSSLATVRLGRLVFGINGEAFPVILSSAASDTNNRTQIFNSGGTDKDFFQLVYRLFRCF
jgi:hypothetical protein